MLCIMAKCHRLADFRDSAITFKVDFKCISERDLKSSNWQSRMDAKQTEDNISKLLKKCFLNMFIIIDHSDPHQ